MLQPFKRVRSPRDCYCVNMEFLVVLVSLMGGLMRASRYGLNIFLLVLVVLFKKNRHFHLKVINCFD